MDEYGHGSHLAGVAAAATHNGIGIAGVAPLAQIMPVRVCDDVGLCYTEYSVPGIRYAARHGADVINLSWGGLPITRADGGEGRIDNAVRDAWEAGAVIVATAGNEGLPLCAEPAATPGVPVICIGATDRDDLPTWYSNSDATLTTIYMVAPGGRGTDFLAGTNGYAVGEGVTELRPRKEKG